MSFRKPNSTPPTFDVPGPIVGAILLLIAVVFFPSIIVTPDIATTFPIVHYRPEIVRSYHTPSPTTLPLSDTDISIDQTFTTLSEYMSVPAERRRDMSVIAALKRRLVALFASLGAEQLQPMRARARERHLQQFLRAITTNTPHPLRVVAERHQLVLHDQIQVPREQLLAWFDLRWEALCSVPAVTPLEWYDLLPALQPEERRAFLSWALTSDCDALLGMSELRLTPMALQQCLQFRLQSIDQTARIIPGYALYEARGTANSLFASQLRRIATHLPSLQRSERELLISTANEYFGKAETMYNLALTVESHSPSETRRIRRYRRGSLQQQNL